MQKDGKAENKFKVVVISKRIKRRGGGLEVAALLCFIGTILGF